MTGFPVIAFKGICFMSEKVRKMLKKVPLVFRIFELEILDSDSIAFFEAEFFEQCYAALL